MVLAEVVLAEVVLAEVVLAEVVLAEVDGTPSWASPQHMCAPSMMGLDGRPQSYCQLTEELLADENGLFSHFRLQDSWGSFRGLVLATTGAILSPKTARCALFVVTSTGPMSTPAREAPGAAAPSEGALPVGDVGPGLGAHHGRRPVKGP